jgi:Zn finger protein HypA/HybF involved in hydrogenase expression
MRLFSNSPIDPRKLTMEFWQIAKQTPAQREHIYGKLHPQWCRCDACKKVAA